MPQINIGEPFKHDDSICSSFVLDVDLFADAGEDGEVKAPKTIPILPNKRHVKARDGREFMVEDPQALIDAVRAGGVDLVVGRQHDEVGWAPAPASGWIDHKTGLRRDGKYGIKADVQWTDVGREYIEKRHGRYVSPVLSVPGMYEFLYEDGPVPVVQEIIAASVVSIPALRMPSLNSRQAAARKTKDEPMNEETRKRVCEALGLPLDAQLETVLAAIEAKGDEVEKLSAALSDFDNAKVTPIEGIEIDLKAWVPREEFDALAKRLVDLEKASSDTRVDQAIAKHRKRIQSPAYEKALRKQLTSGTLTFGAFEELMAATPESALTREDEAAGKDDIDLSALGLEPHELEFCREHNKDPKKFAEIKNRRINKRNTRAI